MATASGHLRGGPAEATAMLVDALHRLGDLAGEQGTRLAVEAHYGEFVESTGDLVDLMGRVDHPRVGINYDPFHFVFLKEDLGASARAAAPWVIHTHIHDVGPPPHAQATWVEREQIPGRGVMDGRPILQALADAGYRGALSIELHRVFGDLATDHAASRDHLLQVLRDLN